MHIPSIECFAHVGPEACIDLSLPCFCVQTIILATRVYGYHLDTQPLQNCVSNFLKCHFQTKLIFST